MQMLYNYVLKTYEIFNNINDEEPIYRTQYKHQALVFMIDNERDNERETECN